jgi:hypothetical protein
VNVPIYGIPGRRFIARVDLLGPVPAHDAELGACWLWTGAVSDSGYGVFRVAPGELMHAHRWMYAACVGPIPAGYQVDHLCHDWTTCELDDLPCEHRLCVNPAHLRAVPAQVNNARSNSPSAVNARKQVCLRGHPLWGGNLYLHPTRGTRHCRACQVQRAAAYEARRAMLVGAAAKRRASRAPSTGQLVLVTGFSDERAGRVSVDL